MNNKQQGDKIPLLCRTIERKCISCGILKDRNSMIRILKESSTGDIVVNPDNKTFGRSFYLCKDKECFIKILKKNKLNKIMKTDLAENVIKEIESVLN